MTLREQPFEAAEHNGARKVIGEDADQTEAHDDRA
jgi:hypothetical protein